MRDIRKTLRIMMASRNYTMSKLCQEFNEKTGATYSKQSWSYKINKEAIKLNEFIVMCDILGYSIEVEDKESHVRISE